MKYLHSIIVKMNLSSSNRVNIDKLIFATFRFDQSI